MNSQDQETLVLGFRAALRWLDAQMADDIDQEMVQTEVDDVWRLNPIPDEYKTDFAAILAAKKLIESDTEF